MDDLSLKKLGRVGDDCLDLALGAPNSVAADFPTSLLSVRVLVTFAL